MKQNKITLKEVLKNNWYWYLLSIIAVTMYLQAGFIGGLLYNDTPGYCGNYEMLYEIWKESPNDGMCNANCALSYGCEESYTNTTHFDNNTNICHCNNGLFLDYSDKTGYDEDWAKYYEFSED